MRETERKAGTGSTARQGRAEWLLWPLRQTVRTSLLMGVGLILLIGLVDWRSADDVPLGFLYLLPMLILGRVLRPWQTLVAAVVCTYLTEEFDPFAWNLNTGLPRDLLYFIAFAAIGLFVFHSVRNRDLILQQVAEIENQSAARLEAEHQLTALIETSPAAIVTTETNGMILTANQAAHRLLCAAPGLLSGENLLHYFPSLQVAINQSRDRTMRRTVMQARGQRPDGEGFLAEVCFSTYNTAAGMRFTAMILDTSEDFRTREEASLHQIMASSRLAISAMSHEVRNVCGAIAAVHRNMRLRETYTSDPDFEALGNLVLALERIATIDLRPEPEQLSAVAIELLLEDLKIVVTPDLAEHDIQSVWRFEPQIAAVWADPTSLMQVFLNLTTNSIRALSSKPGPRTLSIIARTFEDSVVVEVTDNGGGIAEDVELFRPFQAGAQSTGLGLYLARAFVRSFGGDLQHRSVAGGARFEVKLEKVRAR
jgi:two-component system sensor kinase FixL